MTAVDASSPARMVSVDVALKMLLKRISPFTGFEMKLVGDSLGRVAATDICSKIDLPRTRNAAVDGYGVSSETLSNDPSKNFKIVGVARAANIVRALATGSDAAPADVRR